MIIIIIIIIISSSSSSSSSSRSGFWALALVGAVVYFRGVAP